MQDQMRVLESHSVVLRFQIECLSYFPNLHGEQLFPCMSKRGPEVVMVG